nr:MAG TPA: hypothetical protein [Bacteriophage sp.]
MNYITRFVARLKTNQSSLQCTGSTKLTARIFKT